MTDWKRLCGLAVKFLGSQEAFRKEANVLKRLVKQFGPDDVERMLVGARLLHWTSLKSLGSQEGLGRRWALTKYWESQKHAPPKTLESLGAMFKAKGLI